MPEPTELAKVHELVIVDADGSTSSQDVVVSEAGILETPDAAIPPPLPLEHLAGLSEASSVRESIIDAIARNSVGLGHTIAPAKRQQGTAGSADAADELERLLDQLAAKDVRNDSPSFTELLYMVKVDEEEVGQGYIEVLRNRTTGMISGLCYAPSKRIRRLKSRLGYVMLPADGVGSPQPFYEFGRKVKYDRTGQPTNRLDVPRGMQAAWKTNELLRFKRHTSSNRDYGMPRDVAMLDDYLADKAAVETNVAFFEAGGTPPKLIFVRGEEVVEGEGIRFKVPDKLPRQIAETLRGERGGRKRVAVIPLPPGSEAKAIDLGVTSDRDMGFVDFRADNRRRALGSFRMSPIFIADTEDSGRYTAEVERAITLEQVFDPEAQRYERRLRRTLFADLGFAEQVITFKRLAVEGDAVKRESAVAVGEFGAITNGELRDAHGLPARPPDATTDQVPEGWEHELVQARGMAALAPDGAQNRTTAADDQRGLRPGIGGRSNRTDPPESVQRRASQLGKESAATVGKAGGRASRRARRALMQD